MEMFRLLNLIGRLCKTRVMLSLHIATISVRVRCFDREGLRWLLKLCNSRRPLRSKCLPFTEIVATC